MNIEIKCQYRHSPRSIDPSFTSPTESILSLDSDAKTFTITPVVVVRQRSHIPPRQRSVSRSRLDGSNAGSSNNGSGRISGRDLDESDGGDDGGSPARSLSGKMRDTEGLPPTTPFHPKRDPSPLHRHPSNLSHTPSQTPSQSRSESLSRSYSRSRSHSRSRSRSRVMMRNRSLGAHAAFQVDTDIDGSQRPTRLRSRGRSEEEETRADPVIVKLANVVSVDQELPSRKRNSSTGSDFFSSIASDTGSVLTPPKPSDSYRGKHNLHRIFLHTSSTGYMEFSFDNPNSHDILMAFLSAHLKPNQLPRKTPQDIVPPLEGAMQTMVLTPGKMERVSSSIRKPPRITRSSSTDSACTLDKLQKKMIQQRIQRETTPLERIKENMASWMSSIVDCACCQDTTVAPEEAKANGKPGIAVEEMSPASKFLKKKGIGGLSFEESSARMSPRLSFEKSVATESSGRR